MVTNAAESTHYAYFGNDFESYSFSIIKIVHVPHFMQSFWDCRSRLMRSIFKIIIDTPFIIAYAGKH